jgi:hypothetical protein
VEYVIASLIIFYLFMLTMTFVSKRDMRWVELRKRYFCSKSDIKPIEALDTDGRIFYAINGDWSNTNLVSVCKVQGHLYMWGSELSCGWMLQPIKIPLSDMKYIKTKLCFFQKRDVYEISLSNTVLQYAVPKEH